MRASDLAPNSKLHLDFISRWKATKTSLEQKGLFCRKDLSHFYDFIVITLKQNNSVSIKFFICEQNLC